MRPVRTSIRSTAVALCLVALAAVASPAIAVGTARASQPIFGSPSTEPSGSPLPSASGLLFRFADPRIVESSGLATSPRRDGIVYTHNDSGDAARFFAVDSRGQTVAVYTLRGATNVDWEDMASGTDASGRSLLYLADIGDNTSSRKEIAVYQVREPSGPSADVPWTEYWLAYPDGAHDAESLLVEPHTHRLYVATKSLTSDGALYEAPLTLSTNSVNVLTRIRAVPSLTTSGDFSPDGTRMVFLTYLRAYWAAGITGTLHAFDVPLQKQDEAIAFSRDGSSVLVGSEGEHSAVFRVSMLAAIPAASSGVMRGMAPTSTAAAAAASTDAAGDRTSVSWTPLIVAGILAFAGVAYGLARRIRR